MKRLNLFCALALLSVFLAWPTHASAQTVRHISWQKVGSNPAVFHGLVTLDRHGHLYLMTHHASYWLDFEGRWLPSYTAYASIGLRVTVYGHLCEHGVLAVYRIDVGAPCPPGWHDRRPPYQPPIFDEDCHRPRRPGGHHPPHKPRQPRR